MTLIDERELQSEQEKKQRIAKFIIKVIVVLLVMVFILLILRGIAKKKAFKCYINNEKKANVTDRIMYKDNKGRVYLENGKVFISIRELSNTLGYEFLNSEYKKNGEDRTKCQVKVDNIYTSYIAESNQIYRAIVTESSEEDKSKNKNQDGFENIEESKRVEFEYFTVDDNIKYVNDELYASIEAIQIGFDISISYTANDNTLKIYTLDYLENIAKNNRLDTASSTEYSYKNKRLLKYGMVVVKDNDGNYGVASYTDTNKRGTFVASCKYSKLDFNEANNTISAASNTNNQSSILYINLANQEVEKSVVSEFSDMKEMTEDFTLFLVKRDGKYGVINGEGMTVIPLVFDEIGVKEEKYSDLNCKYVLEHKYIPVKYEGKWGLYSTSGKVLISPQYEDIGCSLCQSGDSAIIVPGMDNNVCGVVFLYDREKAFYGVYNADTGERIAVSLTEVFKKVENGEANFYINYIIDRKTSNVHTVNLRTEV